MTPEAWTAHYVLWGLASVAVGWLLHRTASRTRSYQTEAFAHLEADRLALTRFVSGIDEREAARATASAAHLDSILSTPAEDAFYRGFL
ncbi:MAG TPA: hypothetical protein VH092_03475, partial [Urbifossiella sp.]|nr:hypothetical protein [Urbifossiella sp.]